MAGREGGFPVRLDPIDMRKRQLTTSSFRICFQIEKKIKTFFRKNCRNKNTCVNFGPNPSQIYHLSPPSQKLGRVCGYLPGKSRPYFYAQSTALDLLCQDLSSDPKNIYFYFIKYCIKVKYLGISPNVRLGGSHPNYPSTPSQELPGVLRVPSW